MMIALSVAWALAIALAFVQTIRLHLLSDDLSLERRISKREPFSLCESAYVSRSTETPDGWVATIDSVHCKDYVPVISIKVHRQLRVGTPMQIVVFADSQDTQDPYRTLSP